MRYHLRVPGRSFIESRPVYTKTSPGLLPLVPQILVGHLDWHALAGASYRQRRIRLREREARKPCAPTHVDAWKVANEGGPLVATKIHFDR